MKPVIDENIVHTPTPIDPADIRPGDVVERRQRITIERMWPDGSQWVSAERGYEPSTWHLVHRPDPDAEAVQAIRSASYKSTPT